MKKNKGIIKKTIKSVYSKPIESKNASRFLVTSLWILRIVCFTSGMYQLIFGETIIGIAIVTATLFLVVPHVFTKKRLTNIPLEIELFLFVAVFIQFVLGEARNFYTTIPYYDKFVHLFLPGMIAYMGFVIVYTLYFSGKLKISYGTMVVFTILITVGIGALWEIFEYLSDTLLLPLIPGWHKFQGSLTEGPLVDTMNDLIADTVGGIIGALAASKYWIDKELTNKRFSELLHEIKDQLFK